MGVSVATVADHSGEDILSIGKPSPHLPRQLPEGGHLSLVTTALALEAMGDAWRGLELTGARPHGVFQTFDWVRNWTNVYSGPQQSPVIVTGQRHGKLAFALPLMQMQAGPATVLRWLSEPLSQYGDILVAPGEDTTVWCDAALRFLRDQRVGDIIWLRHVRDDAAIRNYAEAHFHDAKLAERAPWLDLSAFANEADYDARYSSSQRKRRKKIRKSLEDDFGPLTFDVLPPGADLDEAILQAVKEKSAWVDERGRHNSILGCSKLPKFLAGMSRATGQARMMMTCLKAGGQPVSWELGLRFGTTHFGFITSHVNALTDYSAARLHMDYSQRLALKDGMKVFDLMVPHDAHKESWSSAMMATNDYHLPLTAKGWVAGRLYLEALRPAMRAAYYRLPDAALRALKPIIGH